MPKTTCPRLDGLDRRSICIINLLMTLCSVYDNRPQRSITEQRHRRNIRGEIRQLSSIELYKTDLFKIQ